MPVSWRRPAAPSAQQLLDALPGPAVVLDHRGEVVVVNRAWSRFADDNGGSVRATGAGTSYVAVCERAAADGSWDAVRVGAALRSILRGDSTCFTTTYPCPAPELERWSTVRLAAIPAAWPGGRVQVLVTHEDVTAQHLEEVALAHRAEQDALTGLGNRLVLTVGLAAALGRGPRPPGHHGVGLVCIDLDEFKPVNDALGHAVGDEVLRSVADRLRRLSRPDDTLARLGGDEFALCVPGTTGAGLAGIARRIELELARPHRVRSGEVHVPASVGCHLAAPGDDVADALDRADAAMYAVKHGRRRDRGDAATTGSPPT